MIEDDQRHAIPLTPEYLSTLDKTQLADLLQNRTYLLSVAMHLNLHDPHYIESLKKEVGIILDALQEKTGDAHSS
jgi:hypothetical protein